MRTTVLLLGIALQVSGATEYKILSECDPSAEVRGVVAKDSQITVHYAIASATMCYSVTSTVDGKQIHGYVLSTDLDAVVAFEQSASKARREMIVAPPPVAAAPQEQAQTPAVTPTEAKKAPEPPPPPKEDPKAKAKAAAELR